MITVVSNNKNLDIVAGQDITFSLSSPLFETERVPVAVSTGIEFAMTQENKITFGFVEAMMFTPKNQKISATIKFAGVDIFIGELQFDEYSDGTLKYSFVEVETNDTICGDIGDAKFPSFKGLTLETFVDNAREGLYDSFALPMIINQANSAKIEYKRANTESECSIIDKYANHIYSSTPYCVPAIKVKYLIEQILPNIYIPQEIMTYIDKLVILGLYKPKEWDDSDTRRPQFYKYGLPTGGQMEPICTDFNLAHTLPEVSSVDFLAGILKMFCATLFCNKGKYEIRTNKSIVTNNHFENWTNKVSAVYSIIVGERSGYALSYANANEPYSTAREDDLGQGVVNISVCDDYDEMIGMFASSNKFISIKDRKTENIYSGKAIAVRLYFEVISNAGVRPYTVWDDRLTSVPTIDIAFQAGVVKKTINSTDDDINSYDNNIEFNCVKCVPASVAIPISKNLGRAQVTMKAVAPIVEFPTIGAERPTAVNIGLLFDNDCLDQGNYYKDQSPYNAPGTEQVNNLSIAIGGEDGLFEKFHKDFANWHIEKKDIIKAELILSPIDVANLQLWRKIMIHNRLYFIKNMGISIADSSNVIVATAEFIRV